MAEDLIIASGSKAEQYILLTKQIAALLQGEPSSPQFEHLAALKEQFNFLWVGFYIVKDDQLVLGPFQGPVACTRIAYDKGVCGKAWASNSTLIVPDVDKFPGHIACSSLSKSEIVVPVQQEGRCIAILDVDSIELAHFDEVDAQYLQEICALLN